MSKVGCLKEKFESIINDIEKEELQRKNVVGLLNTRKLQRRNSFGGIPEIPQIQDSEQHIAHPTNDNVEKATEAIFHPETERNEPVAEKTALKVHKQSSRKERRRAVKSLDSSQVSKIVKMNRLLYSEEEKKLCGEQNELCKKLDPIHNTEKDEIFDKITKRDDREWLQTGSEESKDMERRSHSSEKLAGSASPRIALNLSTDTLPAVDGERNNQIENVHEETEGPAASPPDNAAVDNTVAGNEAEKYIAQEISTGESKKLPEHIDINTAVEGAAEKCDIQENSSAEECIIAFEDNSMNLTKVTRTDSWERVAPSPGSTRRSNSFLSKSCDGAKLDSTSVDHPKEEKKKQETGVSRLGGVDKHQENKLDKRKSLSEIEKRKDEKKGHRKSILGFLSSPRSPRNAPEEQEQGKSNISEESSLEDQKAMLEKRKQEEERMRQERLLQEQKRIAAKKKEDERKKKWALMEAQWEQEDKKKEEEMHSILEREKLLIVDEAERYKKMKEEKKRKKQEEKEEKKGKRRSSRLSKSFSSSSPQSSKENPEIASETKSSPRVVFSQGI